MVENSEEQNYIEIEILAKETEILVPEINVEHEEARDPLGLGNKIHLIGWERKHLVSVDANHFSTSAPHLDRKKTGIAANVKDTLSGQIGCNMPLQVVPQCLRVVRWLSPVALVLGLDTIKVDAVPPERERIDQAPSSGLKFLC